MAARRLWAALAAAVLAGACGGGERAVRVAGGDATGEGPPMEDSVLGPTTDTTGVPGTAPSPEEALPGQRLPGPPGEEAYTLLHDGVAGARPGGAAYLPAPARAALADMAAKSGRRIAVPAATPAIVPSDWGNGLLGFVSWRPYRASDGANGLTIRWSSETWELVWGVAVTVGKADWHGCNMPGADTGQTAEVTIRPGVVGCYMELSGDHSRFRWLRWSDGGVSYLLDSEPLVFTLDELLSVARGEMVTFS